MDTRKVTLLATITAIALVAIGIGYAYTATTENSSNNATDEFVVLSQTNYTYSTSTNLYFDTVNYKDETVKTDYRLLKSITAEDYAIQMNVNGKATWDDSKTNKGVKLFGFMLGSADTLIANYTGTATAPNSYTITVNASNFSDLSSKTDWKYVIVLYRGTSEYQFATYDGASSITYYIWNDDSGWVPNNTGFVLTKDPSNVNQSYGYTTALFFAGSNINDSPAYAHAEYSPGTTEPNVIQNGTLKFIYTKNA